jgi:hypothetical protein
MVDRFGFCFSFLHVSPSMSRILFWNQHSSLLGFSFPTCTSDRFAGMPLMDRSSVKVFVSGFFGVGWNSKLLKEGGEKS